MNYTPEALRGYAETAEEDSRPDIAAVLRAFADAWEADRTELAEWRQCGKDLTLWGDFVSLRKRLELYQEIAKAADIDLEQSAASTERMRAPDAQPSEVVTGQNKPEELFITDGFGNTWSIICPYCGKFSMHVVRPGKVQCSECG